MLHLIAMTALAVAGLLLYRRVTTGDWSLASADHRWMQHNLAGQRHARAKRYEQAEREYLKAVALIDQQNEPDRAIVACKGNLAKLYRIQKRFEQSHQLLLEVMAADQRLQAGPSWYGTEFVVRDAYRLYVDSGRYGEAESMIRRLASYDPSAIPAIEGSDDDLKRLAKSIRLQGKATEADHLKSLIKQRSDTRKQADDRREQAKQLRAAKRFAEAESIYMALLAAAEATYGPEHREVSHILNDLARLRWDQEDYVKAEELFLRCLAIREKTMQPHHPGLQVFCKELAEFYKAKGDSATAEQFSARAARKRQPTG